jgi:tetratricopeptide (TPR) repeat protein
MGNNPYSDGVSAAIPGVRNNWKGLLEDTDAIAKRKLNDPNAKPSEVSSYWSRKGWEYIFENPAQSVKSYLKKIYLFFNAYEIANNRTLYPMAGFSIVFTYLSIKFWFVFPIAAAGVFFAFRNRKVRNLNGINGFQNLDSGEAVIRKEQFSLQTLLILFVVTYALSFSMFFVNMRFRLSVTPILIIFASYSIYCWLTCISKGGGIIGMIRDSGIRNSILIAVITALVIMPYKPQETYEYWQGVLDLGQTYMDQHNEAGEKGIIEELKKIRPEYIASQPKLGSLYFTTLGKLYMVAYGDLDKSVENLKSALNLEPNNNEKYCDIGLVYFMAGRYVEAESYLRKTLAINPKNARAIDFMRKMQIQQ